MFSKKQSSLLILSVLFFFTLQAQFLTDSVIRHQQEINTGGFKFNPDYNKINERFNTRSLFIPGFMIAYGFAAMEIEGLESLNDEIKDEIYAEEPHRKIKIDDYLQFAPGLAVYGLNAMGIKGKHNFRDRSAIYFMSAFIVTTGVYSIKKISHQQRPDGSTFNSFPSGHTAMAFASAEFLRQEYRHVSPWYGYAGYAVAATTGYLRLYNNKHWLSDILGGAGIGIISTRVAYWLYPKIKRQFFKGKAVNTFVMPTYNNNTIGFALLHRF